MTKSKGRRHEGITDLGNHQYRLRVSVRNPRTKTKRVERDRVVKAKSLVEAQRLRMMLREEILAELANGRASTPPRRLGEVADAWLAEITTRKNDEDPSQLHLTNATRLRYEGSVRDFVKPFFGEMIASELIADDVRKWRQHLLEQGYKRATINAHHRVLKQLLGPTGNEAASLVPQLNEKVDARINRKEPNLLTPGEVVRFMAEVKVHWPQHYAMVLVLFTTTLRMGAVRALRRDADIDWESMELVAQQRWSAGVLTPGTKTDRFGENAAPLMDLVSEALEAHWATFNQAQKASGLMFPARDGRPYDKGVLRKCFADVCKRAGITKRFTPHGCRRTGAKLYKRAAGARMSMEIAGHQTLRMHEHYTPDMADEKHLAARHAFGHLSALDGADGQPVRGGEGCGETPKALDSAGGK